MRADTVQKTMNFNRNVYEFIDAMAKEKDWSFTKTLNKLLEDCVVSKPVGCIK